MFEAPSVVFAAPAVLFGAPTVFVDALVVCLKPSLFPLKLSFVFELVSFELPLFFGAPAGCFEAPSVF